LRPFFRSWFSRRLRHTCEGAIAVAYVTKHALQNRYPSGGKSFCFSDVNLPSSGFKSARIYADKLYKNTKVLEVSGNSINQSPKYVDQPFTLIMVGSMAQLYKSPDTLIDAAAICVRGGLNLRLVIVGEGKHRRELEKRALSANLGERIFFTGQLPPGESIRAYLDNADLFVLPSRAEGLPRAMVEAMARGLPCIGSSVGGIPELLPPEDLVPPNNASALARKIREVVTNPDRLSRMSASNFEKARNFHEDILIEQRTSFYNEIKIKTELFFKKYS
jgi:glycosyltransferase involved in cell wall biosynthesis